jgi:hypothetical protein
MQLKNHLPIVLLITFTAANAALAADWPLAAPQPYRAGTFMPVEWTGLYFGVNAGYGWAQGATDTFFTGAFQGGTTTPFGAGPNELGTTKLHGSGNPSGALAGGQIGFNWQAGTFVFGAEMDAQWSGQQSSFTVVCTGGNKIDPDRTREAGHGLRLDYALRDRGCRTCERRGRLERHCRRGEREFPIAFGKHARMGGRRGRGHGLNKQLVSQTRVPSHQGR